METWDLVHEGTNVDQSGHLVTHPIEVFGGIINRFVVWIEGEQVFMDRRIWGLSIVLYDAGSKENKFMDRRI